jgi:hypothetical protein
MERVALPLSPTKRLKAFTKLRISPDYPDSGDTTSFVQGSLENAKGDHNWSDLPAHLLERILGGLKEDISGEHIKPHKVG